jgi:hypothetical protein
LHLRLVSIIITEVKKIIRVRNVDNKALIPPGLSYLADNMLKGNILGASRKKAKWAKGLNLLRKARPFSRMRISVQDKLSLGLIRKMDKRSLE